MRNALDNMQWFRQFLAGDEQAFEHYFNLLNKSIFSTAFEYVQDQAVAEDIAIDAFTSLWKNRKSITSEDHIVAFLKKVAKNLSLNHNKHIEVRNASADDLRLLNEPVDAADVERHMILAERMKRLHKAVEDLPPQCKEVFKLLAFEGLTTKEAAERLGITERNVLNQKTIATNKLKDFFSG